MNPWTLTADEIHRLQGRDEAFAALVNDLIAASAAGALPASTLRLTLKTQAPDGGVDAAVDGSLPAPRDPTGLFGVPTCWQYKAMPSGHLKPPRGEKGGQQAALRAEVAKPHVQELLRHGYGYRLCIADSLPPDQVARWEAWLTAEVTAISPSAPPAVVVTAEMLARWGSRFAGIVRRLRPTLANLLDFDTWRRREATFAPGYVDLVSRRTATAAVREFAGPLRPGAAAVLLVSGPAGVGKTRCVAEALATSPDARARVIVAHDEAAAVDAVARMAAEPDLAAIVVADGMGASARSHVGRLLAAESARIRVIAIDNDRTEETILGEVRLGLLERADLDRVLAVNFSTVPQEVLWAVAGLCEGHPRLAVDVCRHLDRLPPTREVAALAPFVRDEYLAARLSPDQRTAVELVALAARVGYRGAVGGELPTLCATVQAAGLTPERVVGLASGMARAPGFVAVGPRYLYATPRVIAHAAFRSAWDRWVARDPGGFLAALPRPLLDAVGRQVRDAGTPEMRLQYTDFHLEWVRGLAAANLAEPEVVFRLIDVARVDPEALVPPLCDLVEAATDLELAGLDQRPCGAVPRSARWPARRQLVWAAGEFLQLPALAPFAERILYRLARHETENCLNNATGVWCQAYRPLLSGTSVPFGERLAWLERRFDAADIDAEIRLCCRALAGPMTADGPAQRVLGPATVSGRIPESDWIYETYEEQRESWRRTVEAVERLARHPNPGVADAVINTAVEHGFGLLRRDLSALERIVDSRPLTEERRVAVFRLTDRFLDVYCDPEGRHSPVELEIAVRAWRGRIEPSTTRDRLRHNLRRSFGELHELYEDNGQQLLDALATDLFVDPGLLESEVEWLFGEEAKCSHAFGVRLGRADPDAMLLDRIAAAATGRPNVGLLRGYVVGLLDRHPTHVDRVGALIDRFGPCHPALALQLLTTCNPSLDPLRRALELIDRGHLPVTALCPYWQLIGMRSLTPDELNTIVGRLVEAGRAGDATAAQGAVTTLAVHLQAVRRDAPLDLAFPAETGPLVRAALEAAVFDGPGMDDWYWAQVLREYARSDHPGAVRLAVDGLCGEEWLTLHHDLVPFLREAAATDPTLLMAELGRGLLDGAGRRSIRLYELGPVLVAIPLSVARAWVERHGVEGARAIATLLPRPAPVDSVPQVPELTEFVLDRFGGDEEVFNDFCYNSGWERVRSGDIAGSYERDADTVRGYQVHPCRAIREWARRTESSARHSAEAFRVDDEEYEAP